LTQPIKRVVVSLDAVSETAARLAARWEVRLHGVYIEDKELIGFAGLPSARQVTFATGLGGPSNSQRKLPLSLKRP
jgi:hypothetical protein